VLALAAIADVDKDQGRRILLADLVHVPMRIDNHTTPRENRHRVVRGSVEAKDREE
jgi:hypothetical protein